MPQRRPTRVSLLLSVVIGLLPLEARAFVSTGFFAGPARSTGSTAYWNPAAVAAQPETWQMLIDTSLSFIDLGYKRAGIDPNTNQPFERVSFFAPGPDLSFTLASPSMLGHLRLEVGGFSPFALATFWPKHGPQRYFGTRSTFVTYAVVAGPVLQVNDDYGVAILAGPMYGYLNLNTAIDLGAFVNSKLPSGSQPLPLEDPLLEGTEELTTQGVTAMVSLGAWARPTPWLRLGVGVLLPRGLDMHGNVEVQASDALKQAVPGINLNPRGNIEIRYPLPWQVSAEAEVDLGEYTAAALFQYSRKRIQRAIVAVVTDAEPNFIEGPQLSIKNAHDDWMVGARVSRHFTDTLTLGLRLDYMPRSIPNETVHPVNLDYTQVHFSAGAIWRYSEHINLTFGYSYIWIVSYTVTNSVFSPYAPSESGLQMPPANGDYTGWAHMVGFGVEGVWEPTPPSAPEVAPPAEPESVGPDVFPPPQIQ